MTRYGENFELTNDLMDMIAIYMNDDIREMLHLRISPCSNEEFLRKYLELDPEFEKLLQNEFGIEVYVDSMIN